MSFTVAILAGGLATRLRPMSENIPKSLIAVAGRPFVSIQIDLLRRNGLTEFVFCVGHLGKMLQNYLGDGSRFGVNIRYSYDGPALVGTGGGLRKALPLLGETFFVLYGDSYLDCDYGAIEKAFLNKSKLALMTIMKNNGQWDRSNVIYAKGQILCYDKKKHSPDMHYIDYGIGVMRAQALKAYPMDPYLSLETIYQDLIERKQLTAFVVHERFYEIGSWDGIRELERHIRQQTNEGS